MTWTAAVGHFSARSMTSAVERKAPRLTAYLRPGFVPGLTVHGVTMLAAWTLVLVSGLASPTSVTPVAESIWDEDQTPAEERHGNTSSKPRHSTRRDSLEQDEDDGDEITGGLTAAGITGGADLASVILATLLRIPLGCVPVVGLVASLLFSAGLVGTAAASPLAGWAGLGPLVGRRSPVLPVMGPGAGLNMVLKAVGGVASVAGAALHTVAGLIVTALTTVGLVGLALTGAALMTRGDASSTFALAAMASFYVLLFAGAYSLVYTGVFLAAGFVAYAVGLLLYAVGGVAATVTTGLGATFCGRPLLPGESAFHLDAVEVPPFGDGLDALPVEENGPPQRKPRRPVPADKHKTPATEPPGPAGKEPETSTIPAEQLDPTPY